MAILNIVVQLAGILIGWIVVHKLSASRDIDKARREMIGRAADALNDDVTKLFGTAKTYHTTARSIELEDSIKMSLQDISMRISLLSNVANDPTDLKMCTRSVVGLRKAITGLHFEDEHSGPIQANSEQIKGITDEILRAKRALQELKQMQFPPSRASH